MSVTLATFAIYSLFILIITVAAYRHTHSHSDYILGGRRFNALITAMGVGASDMSGWLMQSLPGVVYLIGLSEIWLPVSLLLGSYLNWLFVAPRLRIYTELAANSLTLPAFLENRFCARVESIRYVAALLFLIFFTVYAGSGFVGAAKLFMTAFDVDYMKALWISGPIIVFYCVFGGYLAVNWLDLFQGTLMLIALVLLPVCAIGDFGGMTALLNAVEQIGPEKMNFFDVNLNIAFFSAIAWGLGYFGQPHILVRFMSSRNEQAIKYGRRICISWMALAMAGAVFVGFAGIAYFPAGTLPSEEAVLPELTSRLVNPWLAGFVFAAIISAIMSTVAAVMMAAASSLVNDFYKHRIRPAASQQELVWMGRLSVFLIGVIAFMMALFPENPSIFALVSHAWGGLGAAFGPIILVSLFYRNTSAKGALYSMLAGGGSVLVWLLCNHLFGGIFKLYELLPGFLFGLLGAYIGCRMQKPNDKAVALFDAMKAQLYGSR